MENIHNPSPCYEQGSYVCKSIGEYLNSPIAELRFSNRSMNVKELGETEINEITRSSWYIVYKLLIHDYI